MQTKKPKVDYDRVALGVASRIAARARCAECGKTMDRGAFDPEDQPASHPDKAGRALCLGCWQDGNALCAGCERPFPHEKLSVDEEAIFADPVALLGQQLGPDSYCPGCLAKRRKKSRPLAEGGRATRDPMLEEALRHQKAIDAILDEPAAWWTGSFAEDPNKHKVPKSLDPLGPLSPGCAYCCRPAGDDGLCGECRYEHGE